jgi:hypothetical protein
MPELQFAGASWLEAEQNRGYGLLPIPNKRDDEISALIEWWMALGQEDRVREAAAISESQRQTLLAYSERMASFTVRFQNPKAILLGLVALGIDGWRFDWRENVMLLSLHYNSARKLGLSPNDLFARAAAVLPPEAAHALDEFLQRADKDKSLNVMGFEEGSDENGFRYKRTW